MNKPDWLKVRVRNTSDVAEVRNMLSRLSLNTVCEEAGCPNIMECFGKRTATFMILGRVCTRNCTFCTVTKGVVDPVDPDEPENIARAVEFLGLRHVVVTSVTRDDLPDGGAGHFACVVNRIKELNNNVTVEVLIPDFKGDEQALKVVVDSNPEIINHNVETVPRLYPAVRPLAVYERSLKLLSNVKKLGRENHSGAPVTKSGLMLGLGEREDEVISVLRDLRNVDCDIVTIGQYLAPSEKHHPVVEYIHPEVFERYKAIGMDMGFKYVASSPLVRSSYMAADALNKIFFKLQ